MTYYSKKSYFKIDEVCSIIKIRPYVLRFWETEFQEILATKDENQQKIYSTDIVDILFVIKKLLFEEKLTVEKAKLELHKILKEKKGSSFKANKDPLIQAKEKLHFMIKFAEDLLSSRD